MDVKVLRSMLVPAMVAGVLLLHACGGGSSADGDTSGPDAGDTAADEGAGNDRDDVQAAAEGACAHAYQHRTGDDGWNATVTMSWEVTWEGDGDTGTLTVPDGIDSFEREVDEVETVNNEVGAGDRG